MTMFREELKNIILAIHQALKLTVAYKYLKYMAIFPLSRKRT